MMISVIRIVAILVASMHNVSQIGYRLTHTHTSTLPPPKPPDSHMIKILLLLLSTNIIQHHYCGDGYDEDDLLI